jgi:hypothetical protein
MISTPPRLLAYEQVIGLWPERATIAPIERLDPRDVPASLQGLIPYAEIWGISDDTLRSRIFDQSPANLIEQLRALLAFFEAELEDWFTGPDADRADPSDAYVAFSAMRMGIDLLPDGGVRRRIR